MGHRVVSREGAWLAAVLASGPGAVLSHRSAGALWGVRDTAAARVWVATAAGWFEVDFVWRHERVVVELDGYTHHGTRAAFERDRARDRALQAAGWRVVRVTWRQLHEQPELVATELRALLLQLSPS